MMKMKKMLMISGLFLGLLTLMSSQCNNNSDPVEPDCNGFASASSNGFITRDYCFTDLVTYDFKGAEGIDFNANEPGDTIYSLAITLFAYDEPGTYSLDPDTHGFAELILHGNETEFYKVQSGSITITEADTANLKATFDIVTEGFYNKETVNITGTIDKK